MKSPLLLCLCFSMLVSEVFGQAPAPAGSIKEAEFVIEKEKKNDLPESSRLFKKAILSTQVPKANQQLTYDWAEINPILSLLDHKIKLLKAKQDFLTKLYGNYLKLGYGTEYTPYLACYLDNANHAKYGYGLHLGHLSTGKTGYAETYHNFVRLHGKWATEQVGLDGAIYYQGDKHALVDLRDQAKHDPKQAHTFHRIGLQTNLANYASDQLQFQVPLYFSHLRNRQDEQENTGTLQAKVSYPLKENLMIETNTYFGFGRYQYKKEPVNNRHIERLKPSLVLLINDFRVQAGFNLVYQNDVSAVLKQLTVYPTFEVNYKPFKWLRPYIGLGGDIQPNFWHTLVADNPWLASQPVLGHTNESFVFYGGIQGDITPQTAFYAGAKLGSYQNLPFFLNTVGETRNFAVEYDPETSLLNIFSELNHTNHRATLVTRLKGNYYAYKPKKLPKPWHKPSYDLELLSTYNLYDKILLKGNLYCLGGVEALDPTTQTAKPLKDIIDVGFGVDYLWNQRVSVFLECQNLLARAQPRYLNTSSRGLNFLLGVSYIW